MASTDGGFYSRVEPFSASIAGGYTFSFGFYPVSYQPSGHVNLPQARIDVVAIDARAHRPPPDASEEKVPVDDAPPSFHNG